MPGKPLWQRRAPPWYSSALANPQAGARQHDRLAWQSPQDITGAARDVRSGNPTSDARRGRARSYDQSLSSRYVPFTRLKDRPRKGGEATFAQLKFTRELPPALLSMLVADVSRTFWDTARPLMAPPPVPV